MGPLIDQELEKVDRKHAQLTQLSADLVDALNLYHTLMREPSFSTLPKMGPGPATYGYGPPPGPAPQQQVNNKQKISIIYFKSVAILWIVLISECDKQLNLPRFRHVYDPATFLRMPQLLWFPNLDELIVSFFCRCLTAVIKCHHLEDYRHNTVVYNILQWWRVQYPHNIWHHHQILFQDQCPYIQPGEHYFLL